MEILTFEQERKLIGKAYNIAVRKLEQIQSGIYTEDDLDDYKIKELNLLINQFHYGISAQKDLLYLRAYVYGYSGELDTIYANYENGTINEAQFTAQIEALQADASNAAPDFTLTIIGNIK